jgi:hypothetical protein
MYLEREHMHMDQLMAEPDSDEEPKPDLCTERWSDDPVSEDDWSSWGFASDDDTDRFLLSSPEIEFSELPELQEQELSEDEETDESEDESSTSESSLTSDSESDDEDDPDMPGLRTVSDSESEPEDETDDDMPDLQSVSDSTSECDFEDDAFDDMPELEGVSDSESEGSDCDEDRGWTDLREHLGFETTTCNHNEFSPAPETRSHDIHACAAAPSKAKGKGKARPEGLEYQRTASTIRDFTRLVPRPMVIVVYINNHPVTALVDSGSLGDFMSSTLADQLKIKPDVLAKPLNVTMAASGSRTVVNYNCKVRLAYQGIDEDRTFDIMNIATYDLILGTPFIFQHQLLFGLDPPQIGIGSLKALPIRGEQVTTLASLATDLYEDNIETLRTELRAYAADICIDASKTDLPPL